MYTFFVSKNDQLTPSTILLTLIKSDSERLFSFQPGQYAAISFIHRGRPTPARCFSIVSSPTEQDVLEFSMRTGGKFTKAISTLVKGDKVNIYGPFGEFVFDGGNETDIVLIAGGIGITPFMSMIQYATTTQLANNITLIFGCSSQDDIPFLKQLKSLEDQNAHFKTIFVISRGPIDKLSSRNTKTGRITSDLVDTIIDKAYSNKTFYICGPRQFMNGTIRILKDKGISDDKIVTEAFGQGPDRQTGKIQSWSYNVYVLSAISLLIGTIAVTVGDLLKTLPPASVIDSAKLTPVLISTNSRQQDLDKLVNNLAPQTVNSPESPAVQAAILAASRIPAPVAPVSSTAATPTTTVTPTPVIKQKTCTTTQSGVTTCV